MSHHHHCHGHHHHGCCEEHECGCCCHHHHHSDECHEHHDQGDFASQLLQLADEAWMEVLKEKIKAQVIKGSGAHLDKLAKLVADGNKDRWRLKLGAQKGCDDFHEKVAEFFRHE